MSQAAAKLGLTIEEERVRVLAHFRTEGSVRKGTKQSSCSGFEIELHIESEEAREPMSALAAQAHRMCYTEAALAGQVELRISNYFNGELL